MKPLVVVAFLGWLLWVLMGFDIRLMVIEKQVRGPRITTPQPASIQTKKE